MGFPAFPVRARSRVLVTGVGMVTPIGSTAPRTWASLCDGASGTKPLSAAPYFMPSCVEDDRQLSPHVKQQFYQQLLSKMPCQVAAPVLDSHCAQGLISFAPTAHEPRSCQFSKAAVREALHDAQLLTTAGENGTEAKASASSSLLCVADLNRVGVNLGVGIPSLSDVGDVSHALFGQPSVGDPKSIQYSKVHPFFVSKILGNTPTALSSIAYGITGPTSSSVAACATGAYCIGEAASWIQSGRVDVAICGSTEACITPVSMAGFSRMKALSTAFNTQPNLASRPFDQRRAGFVMGEGAGVMILESESHALQRGVNRHNIYAELRGFGISSDAYHVAAPHPDGKGAQRCVLEALRDGGDVPLKCVGYVNAHATGTIGDTVEYHALQRALRPDAAEGGKAHSDSLWVSSSKGALGHLLGAAGSVEAVIAILALRNQIAPPNVNMENPIVPMESQAVSGVRLVENQKPHELRNCEAVLSTSFGFGGMNSALLFTRYA